MVVLYPISFILAYVKLIERQLWHRRVGAVETLPQRPAPGTMAHGGDTRARVSLPMYFHSQCILIFNCMSPPQRIAEGYNVYTRSVNAWDGPQSGCQATQHARVQSPLVVIRGSMGLSRECEGSIFNRWVCLVFRAPRTTSLTFHTRALCLIDIILGRTGMRTKP